jgi:hypothetical protein
MGHGDIEDIIDPFPWACCNGPWDIENLSNELGSMVHGMSKMSLTLSHGFCNTPWEMQ